MTSLLFQAYHAADTAVAGTSLNALATAGYAMGAAIDNSADLLTDADLLIVLSSAVTAGATNPNVSVWVLPAIDGTNYPTPPGGTAGAAPNNLWVGSIIVPASSSVSALTLRGILIPPCLFKVQIQTNLGVTLPATNTSTCQLYRYGLKS